MKRIMIVEDDDIMRDMLVQMLSKEGYSVTAYSNGRDATLACESEKFDLVVTDMVMPIMDGIQTVRELCKNHKGIKIIAISGGDRSFDGTTYLYIADHIGADKVFEKPFGRDEFLKAINELLNETDLPA